MTIHLPSRDHGPARVHRRTIDGMGIRAVRLPPGSPTADELVRRNAFRVAGLPTDADRDVTEARCRELEQRTSGCVPSPEEAERLDAAADLRDVRTRLWHELLAPWAGPSGCPCPRRVHREHDAAVAAYARALRAPERPAAWRRAGGCWTAALDDDGFWTHLRHRAEVLGAAADVLLAVAARTEVRGQLLHRLLEPLLAALWEAERPAPLRSVLDEVWGLSPAEVDRRLWHLVAETDAALDLTVRAASDEPDAAQGLRRLLRDLHPAHGDLHRWAVFAPAERHPGTRYRRERAARVLVAAAVEVLHDGLVPDPDGRIQDVRVGLLRGRLLATTEATREAADLRLTELAVLEREVESIREAVRTAVITGRRDRARRHLEALRPRVAGTPLAAVVDRGLAEMGVAAAGRRLGRDARRRRRAQRCRANRARVLRGEPPVRFDVLVAVLAATWEVFGWLIVCVLLTLAGFGLPLLLMLLGGNR